MAAISCGYCECLRSICGIIRCTLTVFMMKHDFRNIDTRSCFSDSNNQINSIRSQSEHQNPSHEIRSFLLTMQRTLMHFSKKNWKRKKCEELDSRLGLQK